VLWDATTSVFNFKSRHVVEEFPPTKRMFLKGSTTSFDPLRFLSCRLSPGLILIPAAWICGANWDDSLPEDLAATMISWYTELQRLTEITVHKFLQLKRGLNLSLFMSL